MEIGCIFSTKLPGWLDTDPTRLTQILTNLTANAVNFTDSGRVLIDVDYRALDTDSADLCITVRDTGIGMPAEALQDIFDAFTQADGSVTRKHGGTGLGVTISRQLSHAMGGDMKVASEMGVGSEFRFSVRVFTSTMETPHDPRAEMVAEMRAMVVQRNSHQPSILGTQLEALRVKTSYAHTDAEVATLLANTSVDFVLFDDLGDSLPGIELALFGSRPVIYLASAGNADPQPPQGADMQPTKPLRVCATCLTAYRQ